MRIPHLLGSVGQWIESFWGPGYGKYFVGGFINFHEKRRSRGDELFSIHSEKGAVYNTGIVRWRMKFAHQFRLVLTRPTASQIDRTPDTIRRSDQSLEFKPNRFIRQCRSILEVLSYCEPVHKGKAFFFTSAKKSLGFQINQKNASIEGSPSNNCTLRSITLRKFRPPQCFRSGGT